MALTAKQQRFVDEYLIDMNGAQAAIRAGYSKNGASVQAGRMLANANIAEAVAVGRQEMQNRTHVTQDMVVRELARVGLSDIRKMMAPSGHLLPLDQLDDDTARAIASVEVSTKFDDSGDMMVHKIKMWDKNSALEKLARHLGMFNDKLNLDVGDGVKELMALVDGKSR